MKGVCGGCVWRVCKQSMCVKRRKEGGRVRRESNEGERGNSKGPLSTGQLP